MDAATRLMGEDAANFIARHDLGVSREALVAQTSKRLANLDVYANRCRSAQFDGFRCGGVSPRRALPHGDAELPRHPGLPAAAGAGDRRRCGPPRAWKRAGRG
jgi:hypothetical protein